MKKLIAAVAAMLAATLFSGNALAVTGSQVKALHVTASAAVKAGYCRHRNHGCYHRACAGCGCGAHLYTYTTRYTTCGTCGGGACWGGCGPYYGPQCGCGPCGAGCGYYGGGWSLFGWLF
jgi:hypothetical protein